MKLRWSGILFLYIQTPTYPFVMEPLTKHANLWPHIEYTISKGGLHEIENILDAKDITMRILSIANVINSL